MASIEARVRSCYDSLSRSEQKVAAYFLKHTEEIFRKPIAELALEAGVSKVAWVRFCKTIGFDGLKDLKKALFEQMYEKEETVPEPFSDIRNIADTRSLIEGISQSSIRAIRDTADMLDPQALERAAEWIFRADSVRIFGVGASGLVGEDLHTKLVRISKTSYFSMDIHSQLAYAATMSPRDVAVLISLSGRTREILEVLNLTKRNGVPTLVLTRNSRSPMAQNADLVFSVSAPEIDMRSGATSSRMAQLMVIDALFTAVAHMDYDTVTMNLERSRESVRSHRVGGIDPVI